MMNRQATGMQVVVVAGVMAALVAGVQGAGDKSFADFIKRDQEAFQAFRTGRKPGDRAQGQAASREESPQRQRALAIYRDYCRLRGILEDPNPERGLNTRIAALRAKLFPTNRPWVDSLSLWGDQERYVEWPLLQDLEARAVQVRADLVRLEAAWRDEGFSSHIGRGLDDCYGRKAWYVYLDKEDQSVFPSPIRSNQVDYVENQLDYVWPTNEAPVAVTAPPAPETVVHDAPPPPGTPPPEIPEIDETIRPENIEVVKSWDEMTPEERRRALMENRPEAWSGFCRDVFGTDTNGQALAKAVVACSNVTAVTTNIAIANLPPPTPVTGGKAWDAMTTEERHNALKANRPEAWDGLRDALLSGDGARLREVLEALSARPAINDTARAVAYWHGYQVGQMENATTPESSTIDTVVAAYVHPELMALVRQGYADAKAGKPALWGLPAPDAMQQKMPTAPLP
jgi:hypothetical protein